MADVKGTPGKDVYKVKPGEFYYGLDGDDVISFEKGGIAEGGQGNDEITVPANFLIYEAIICYWSAKDAIFVDLDAGYALDGLGSKDILINVHNVHGFKQSGDKGYGSSGDDNFFLSPYTYQQGKIYIDGRGGYDNVEIGIEKSRGQGELVLTVSADARKVIAYQSNFPGFIFELNNIESVATWEHALQKRVLFDLTSLIDITKIGQETLLRGYKGWQIDNVGTQTTLTYSFLNQVPASGYEGGTGFSAFTAAQQQTVRDLFYVLQNQTGLAFTEVSGDTGQIRFGVNQQSNTRGYSFIPDELKGDARAGDVWIDQETVAFMKPGQEGYYVLLHELAHALGLQHPLPETDTSGATVLLNSFSSISNTVMLDVSDATQGNSWPTWFGNLDIQALRYLYGYRAYSTSNDVYAVTNTSSNMSIVDDGGVDSLDASAASISARIDLREGKVSSIGANDDGTAKINNVSVSIGSFIENVTGTLFDDRITGNQLNNLITYTSGNDIVDGLAGIDSIRVWKSSSEFSVKKDSATGFWYVQSSNNTSGTIELRNTERLLFSDMSCALDTGDVESAGRTAKILGAVFGKDGFLNLSFRGIGLYFLDNGWSYEALTQLALDARLGAGASKEIVAQLLQSNVPGLILNPSEFISTAAIAIAAQESNLNKVQINLVGITEAGLPFTLFG
jgi:serralysin